MDYTTLSLPDVMRELDNVTRDARDTFGRLDGEQLNWRPDATAWSVAQCFEHLLAANRLMITAARNALSQPPGVWQRMPGLPGFFGRVLVRSQSPQTTRKARTSAIATPSRSTISADVIQRFAGAHDERSTWIRSLDPNAAARTVMVSPFLRVITYSVLDGCRLMAAHDRRHFEQARRVTESADFPSRATG